MGGAPQTCTESSHHASLPTQSLPIAEANHLGITTLERMFLYSFGPVSGLTTNLTDTRPIQYPANVEPLENRHEVSTLMPFCWTQH